MVLTKHLRLAVYPRFAKKYQTNNEIIAIIFYLTFK